MPRPGSPAGAARCALWLAFHLGSQGELAQAGGWFARANWLVEHEPQDCLEPSHAAAAGQLAVQSPQRVQPVQLVAAEGEQHQHRAVAEVGGQEGDQVAGGAVGPAQALHDQQQPSRGQPLDHAQQELEEPPLTGAPDRGAHGLPVAPGKVGNQAGQLGTGGTGNRFQLVRVEGAGQPTQRLGDRRERHALLTERHAAAAQHQHAQLGRR
jgi:hypothetical protein